jgi:hypothetical protein
MMQIIHNKKQYITGIITLCKKNNASKQNGGKLDPLFCLMFIEGKNKVPTKT